MATIPNQTGTQTGTTTGNQTNTLRAGTRGQRAPSVVFLRRGACAHRLPGRACGSAQRSRR